MEGFLLLRNIQVENANCIAGQTWGFPAISNFLGFTHALQRKLAEHTLAKLHLNFTGCAVICHQLAPQTHQASQYAEHVFSLTRNPLTKDAKTASFVEEGRTNMTVSLVIGVESANFGNYREQMEQEIFNLIPRFRLAGGTITQLTKARLVNLNDSPNDQAKQVNFWMRTLLPGYTLVSRPQLLAQQAEHFTDEANPELSAWFDNSTLHFNAEGKVASKNYAGWIRPIPVGYRAISEKYQAGEVAKSRDSETPVRFVEYAYSLGEWLSPHRINQLEHIMWHYSDDAEQAEQGWYLCHNNYEQHLATNSQHEGL